MFDSDVWRGVESLLDAYAKVATGDFALLLYASDSYECAAWVSVGLELRGVPVRRVWMAPLQDPGFPSRLAEAMPDPMPQRLLVFSFERDTFSHTDALNAALAHYPRGRCVVLRTISAGAELFAQALRAAPQELSARNAALLERLMPARRLRITTAGGTDVQVRLDPRHRWISNRGSARPGGTVVLPAGEVATYPAAVDGRFVADFAFNVNTVTARDARLDRHPVELRVEGGRAVAWHCEDPATLEFVDSCFAMDHGCRIGELGFGTNTGVGEPVALNSHMNERRCGVHFGFGQHNQGPGRVDYQALVHLDLIARGGRVWVDDEPEPIDLDLVQPSVRMHPLHARDEDVFAPGSVGPTPEDDDADDVRAAAADDTQDCCGMVGGALVCVR